MMDVGLLKLTNIHIVVDQNVVGSKSNGDRHRSQPEPVSFSMLDYQKISGVSLLESRNKIVSITIFSMAKWIAQLASWVRKDRCNGFDTGAGEMRRSGLLLQFRFHHFF